MSQRSVPQVYVLHGMKRSGNHALINWLLPQLRCGFVNNAIPMGSILRGAPFPQPVAFDTWRARHAADSVADGRLLVSIEDHSLSVLPFFGEGVELRRLLIIRQPEQLFASRIRKAFKVEMPAYPRRFDAVMRRTVETWKEHARCYLGQGPRPAGAGHLAVSFEAWVTCAHYRAAISQALGVCFDDSGFGAVSREGGGSSFDGAAFDGRGQEMNVLDRASQLEPRERALLDHVLDDGALRALGEAVREADALRRLRGP